MQSRYWTTLISAGVLAVSAQAPAQSTPDNKPPQPQWILVSPDDAQPKDKLVLVSPRDGDELIAVDPAQSSPKMLVRPYDAHGGAPMIGGKALGAHRNEPWIGVSLSEVPPVLAHQLRLRQGGGAVVEQVFPGSPAEKAGIEQYDIITRFDDQSVKGAGQLPALVQNYKSGQTVQVTVIREGKRQKIGVTLSRRKQIQYPGGYMPVPKPSDDLAPRYEVRPFPKGGFAPDDAHRLNERRRAEDAAERAGNDAPDDDADAPKSDRHRFKKAAPAPQYKIVPAPRKHDDLSNDQDEDNDTRPRQ